MLVIETAAEECLDSITDGEATLPVCDDGPALPGPAKGFCEKDVRRCGVPPPIRVAKREAVDNAACGSEVGGVVVAAVVESVLLLGLPVSSVSINGMTRLGMMAWRQERRFPLKRPVSCRRSKIIESSGR